MANRTYDKPETAIKGLVEIPFQFTVNASGVVTAQYPSAATVTIAKDGTTASQYNLTFADKFNAFLPKGRGKRAEALISIAHPDFRASLAREVAEIRHFPIG